MTATPPHGGLSCDDAKRLLPLYVDRECSPDDAQVVADHLVRCEPCAEEAAAARALRSTLREACREEAAPVALRDRVRASLRYSEGRSLRRHAPWVASVLAASIVGVVVLFPKEAEPPAARSSASAPAPAPASATASATAAARPVSFARLPEPPSSFPLVRVAAGSPREAPASPSPNPRASAVLPRHAEEIARRHERPIALDIASPEPAQIARFLERRLNFSIHLPPIIARGGQLLGARLTELGDARAAHLLFHKDGHKLSLFAFESGDPIPASGPGGMVARNVSFLRVGHINVVQWERGTVRYAFASNLGANEMLRLVRANADNE
ncbi:MAG: zf-HC2 domain-containing protein [Deltaproteobacteria bacterium]|nr:zf-HC2 domain-containing protein [Deltaproteobacteria bacterium]